MKGLFLDDLRDPPETAEGDEWIVARSYKKAVELLSTQEFDRISLDHDLGENVKTGYDLAKWMTANNRWPDIVDFHTANPVGRKNMIAELTFWRKYKGPEETRPYDPDLDREIL